MSENDESDCCCNGLLTSNDVRTAIISGETFKNKTVTYAAVDGKAVVEGCIVIGNVDDVERKTAEAKAALDVEEDREGVAHGVVVTGADKRWPNATLPYEIASNLPAINRQRVEDAINHWEANTAIRFVERNSGNASQYGDYVRFIPSNGCWSYVGKQGGMQEIGLATGCGFGATVHEIGHALGLWHEQSREDRDSRIQILWQNIEAGKEHNFNQHISDGDDVGAYDYGSIMHYGRFAFSKNGQPTIETIPAGQTIGQRNGLSPGDIAAIHSIYQVWDQTTLSRVYCSHGSKNAWVMPAGKGWRRLDPKSEDGVENLFDLCCFAFAFDKQVSLFMDGSTVFRAQLV